MHTSLDSFINLSLNRPINSFLIGYLTFSKYEMALIKGILKIILLAVGWVVDVAILHRHKTCI